MHIIIETPTKAYLTNYAQSDIQSLKNQFDYSNTSIAFLLKKHHQKQWLKDRDFDQWQDQLRDLERQLNSTLVEKDDRGYWIRPGLISYIHGINYTVTNKVNYPEVKPIPWTKKLEFEPYDYQRESVENLINIKHGNISLCTGAGKTACLLMVARNMGLDAVIVTPSQSIFRELLEVFTKYLGKGTVGGYGDGLKDLKKRFTVTIAKSLTTLKPGTDSYDFFYNKKVLLYDEAHCTASATLEDCCHGVLGNIPYRFFCTATIARGDGSINLLKSIVGHTVQDLTIGDAIEGGYLCPLNFKIISVVSPSTRYKKDPIECKREHLLYNKNVAEMCAKIANASWKLKQESTLILVEELYQISMLKDILTVPFTYAHAGSKAEAEKWGLTKVNIQDEIERFNNGEVKVLVGTRCLATGTNIFGMSVTLNWVGGSSEVVTKQGSMGRSTRKIELSKYAKFHKAISSRTIYDFDIKDQPILQNQLKTRIKFYKEANGTIEFF